MSITILKEPKPIVRVYNDKGEWVEGECEIWEGEFGADLTLVQGGKGNTYFNRNLIDKQKN